jgi:hypothetical protein
MALVWIRTRHPAGPMGVASDTVGFGLGRSRLSVSLAAGGGDPSGCMEKLVLCPRA